MFVNVIVNLLEVKRESHNMFYCSLLSKCVCEHLADSVRPKMTRVGTHYREREREREQTKKLLIKLSQPLFPLNFASLLETWPGG